MAELFLLSVCGRVGHTNTVKGFCLKNIFNIQSIPVIGIASGPRKSMLTCGISEQKSMLSCIGKGLNIAMRLSGKCL
jgi:hypothetical protein